MLASDGNGSILDDLKESYRVQNANSPRNKGRHVAIKIDNEKNR